MYIVALTTLAGWLSTLSSFIYYPVITSVARDLRTRTANINLTVTSYMIISGVAASDHWRLCRPGRTKTDICNNVFGVLLRKCRDRVAGFSSCAVGAKDGAECGHIRYIVRPPFSCLVRQAREESLFDAVKAQCQWRTCIWAPSPSLTASWQTSPLPQKGAATFSLYRWGEPSNLFLCHLPLLHLFLK